jgi:hypothetical protein
MGSDDVAVLLERISNLHELVQELRSEVKALSLNGCSKAGAHTEASKDHEQRIRLVEVFMATMKGQSAVISLIVSAGIAVLVSWLTK